MGKRGQRVAGVALVSSVILVCCIEANTIECGDLACPAELQCRADRCVTDEQVEACGDLVETAPCMASGVLNGHCLSGVCIDSICGNGVVDLGEACDDSNTIGEDGCSATCDSTETCGNAVVDLFREQCDEGIGTLSGDGCSSQCAVEYPTWRRETPRALIARTHHSLVTVMHPDPSKRRVLMFGGANPGVLLDETWEWMGGRWRLLQPRTSPPARSNAMMAYDIARDRVVLFGGGALRDVWEWDGRDWHDRTPTSGVGPSSETPIGAYLATTSQLIVYDGRDTFQWDGTSWIKLAVVSAPPNRIGGVMAYRATSATTGQIVLFGGSSPGPRTDTWTFDGASWQQAIGPGPSGRVGAVMATDFGGTRVILHGGGTGGAPLIDTWSFNGVWTQLAAGVTKARTYAAATYDPSSGKVMVVHGLATFGIERLSDQIELSGTQWTAVSPGAALPSPACSPAMGYLPGSREVLYLGGTSSGSSGSGSGSSTGEFVGPEPTRWDGIQWVGGGATVPRRCEASIAATPQGDRMVMFGGVGSGSGSGSGGGTTTDLETWTSDGRNWMLAASTGPSVRFASAMTQDPRMRTVVLHGGSGPYGTGSGGGSDAMIHGDTWDWNGTAWTERATTGGPVRNGHGLAYDRTTGTIVLYGGSTRSGTQVAVRETWELDGVTWRNLATPSTPEVSLPVQMVTGPRGRPLVIDTSRRTWELRRETGGAANWVELLTIDVPPTMVLETATYDAARDQVLLSGTVDGSVQLWSLSFVSPLPRESCTLAEDRDTDGMRGCGNATYAADPDCWSICDPVCSPYEAFACEPTRPRCGDSLCSAIEDFAACPADCPAP